MENTSLKQGPKY